MLRSLDISWRGHDLPLHVAAFCPSERKDSVLSQDIETQGINALLVDDDKVLLFLVRIHSLVANEVLELDDLAALGVREAAFRLDELLALFCRRVEEAGVDLAGDASTNVEAQRQHIYDVRLLVFEADVQSQNERVLQALGHVRMPCTVIQDQAADELRL